MKQFHWSLILLIALAIHPNILSAQITTTSTNGSTIRTARVIPSGIISSMNTPLEMEVKGTPYLSDDFTKSKLYLKAGNFEGVPMRYNIYNDTMEFTERDSVFAIGPDKIVDKVVIGDRVFVIDNLEIDGTVTPTYFQRLDSGRATLLTKMVVIYREAQVGKPMEGNVPPTYARNNDIHFLKVRNEPVVKITNIKKLIDSLPDHKTEMEAFAKKEKIQANKAKELTKFIQYYNSL